MNTFTTDNNKKRVQKCKDYHENKIDKLELTTDDLQAYAIYATATNTFKETKDRITKQYNKDLEALELEEETLAKEINEQLVERDKQQDEQKRTKEIERLRKETENIQQDIKRIERAIVIKDQFISREDITSLDKALARRYQQKQSKHKRNLENRVSRRQQIVKGRGLSLEVEPDDDYLMVVIHQ